MSVFLYIMVWISPVSFTEHRAQSVSFETCTATARAIRKENVQAWCHREHYVPEKK